MIAALLLALLPSQYAILPSNPYTGQPLPSVLFVKFGATVYPDQSLQNRTVPLQWYSDVRFAFEINRIPTGIGLCRTGPGWVAVLSTSTNGSKTIVTMSEFGKGVLLLQIATVDDCRTSLSNRTGIDGVSWTNAELLP